MKPEIFLMHIGKVSNYEEAYFRLHFPERFERSKKFRFEEDRLRCLAAGILLYEQLGYEDQDLLIGEYGKPLLQSGNCHFSLSHSGDYTALAVCRTPVGIDIEKHDRRHLGVARRVFVQEECDWMAATPDERFFQLWTMKESMSKALGLGLSIDFRSFCVLPLIQGKKIFCQGKTFVGQSFALPGYGASVVYMKN